jgi:Replication protein
MLQYISPAFVGNPALPFLPFDYPLPPGFGGDPVGGFNSDSDFIKSDFPSITSVHKRPRSYIPTAANLRRRKKRQKSKDLLIKLLDSAELHEDAAKVGECGREIKALSDGEHVVGAAPKYRCGNRLCADCAANRQRKAVKRLLPALKKLKRLHPHGRFIHLTLTIRSQQEITMLTDLKGSFRRLRRTKAWEEHIFGGAGTVEDTYNPEKGHHFHIHLLLLRGRYWPHAEIRELWIKITHGEGEVVHIKPAGSLEKGVLEVTKYIHDPTNLKKWGPEQVKQFSTLKRVKFAECYGELRGIIPDLEDKDGEEEGVELEAGDPCPICGKKLSLVIISRELFNDLAEEAIACGERGPPGF